MIFLGLAKGGFSGVGTAATPLLALYLPPLEAAALLLPILLCQDVISVYVFRREWDSWKSEGHAARGGTRYGCRLAFLRPMCSMT